VGRECTFHEILSKGLTIIYLVAMSRTYTEAGKVLIEIDKEHFGAHWVNASCGEVHDDIHAAPTSQQARDAGKIDL
jgi:hypothetical protein